MYINSSMILVRYSRGLLNLYCVYLLVMVGIANVTGWNRAQCRKMFFTKRYFFNTIILCNDTVYNVDFFFGISQEEGTCTENK